MYKILAFDNGQPAILYHNGHNVYMYTAIRGHIHPEGIIFNDVKDDFRIYDGNKKYAFYISTDNKIKTATLSGNHFMEFLSIPLEDSKNGRTIVNVSPIMCENELYIFYCTHNNHSNLCDVYYLLCSAPNHTCLIKRNIKNYNDFDVVSSNRKTYIILQNDCYYLTKNGTITTITKNGPDNVNLAANETIEQLKDSLSEKSSELIKCQKQIYEKNMEISNLKFTKKQLSRQCEQLSSYVGKLQDELRRIKFM